MIKNAKTRKFKIEDSVINALSEFFEFEIYEIREAYSICNSFDLTLKALENAEANHTTPACESQSLIDKNNEYKIDEKIEKDKYK